MKYSNTLDVTWEGISREREVNISREVCEWEGGVCVSEVVDFDGTSPVCLGITNVERWIEMIGDELC